MNEKNVEIIIDNMAKVFEEKLSLALHNTGYASYTSKIVEDYRVFLYTAVNYGLINNMDDFHLFDVFDVEYFDGLAYASWNTHRMTIQKRFFIERTEEEQRNVIFHELLHSLVNKMISDENNNIGFVNYVNFIHNMNSMLIPMQVGAIRSKYSDIFTTPYYNQSSNMAFDATQSFNEVTTQYLAETLCAISYGKPKMDMQTFSSKILTDNNGLLSDFSTYPEYEQIFLDFLRTINGFGQIDNNDELFNKWLVMLSNGSIWNQMICTYKNKDNLPLLFDFLISFGALRIAKEKAMGIGVEYLGDKEKLTSGILELDEKLKQLRNYDPETIFEFEEYQPIQRETIKLSSRR